MKDKLIAAVIKNKDNLSYVNLNDKNEYMGWIHNFNIKSDIGDNVHLNLSNEKDLFLLFVLASSWSKTGPWENAAFFTAYLKLTSKDDMNLWLNSDFVDDEIKNSAQNAKRIVEMCTGVVPRKRVSFRKDYYASVVVLATNWNEIKQVLDRASRAGDYWIFIEYISNLEGLGAGKNKMRIKIPLILRELRCQRVYDNIPGELCCVPDERVKVSSKEIGINIPTITSIKSLFRASKIIYDNFGDLYDIPLFAYEDVRDEIDF